jgi:uncharacterized protein YfaP (DUF2135 family)
LINPIAKSGSIDPPIKFLYEMTWDDDSWEDIDFYVKGPHGKVIWYGNRENGYLTLKRDDLGQKNDMYEVNGRRVIVRSNYETVTAVDLPDGDYVVNVHYFSDRNSGPVEVTVKLTNIAKFGVVFEGTVTLSPRQEQTVIVFRVVDGNVVDMRDDVQVRLRGSPEAP